MKKKTTHLIILFRKFSKSVVASFKSAFESPDKREFKRLKDFIAS